MQSIYIKIMSKLMLFSKNTIMKRKILITVKFGFAITKSLYGYET